MWFVYLIKKIEQRCFELGAQLQQLQELGQREESVVQELTNGKARAETELEACRDQIRSLESKVLS